MKKIFVDKIENNRIMLTGDEHVHLSVVLRAKRGENIEVSQGDSFVYVCQIAGISKNSTALTVLERLPDSSEPGVEVTLFFAVQKGEHNDFTVQKAVELGVSKLVPIATKYTVAQGIKRERLSKIAVEAAKQCGRNKVPPVCEISDLNDVISTLSNFDLCVFPYEKVQAPGIRYLLRNFNPPSGKRPKVAIIIGAEGGFDKHEAEALRNAGVTPVTLGRRILRADTACLAVLTCVMYEMAQFEILQTAGTNKEGEA